MKNYKSGFTAVGMLISLVVLSVIFMLSMPVLKTNMKARKANENKPSTAVKQVSYKTLLERAYSELSQVLATLPTDFGTNDLASTGLFAQGVSNQILGEAIGKHLSIVKNCDTSPSLGCFATSVINPASPPNIRANYDSTPGFYRFITNRGMSMLVNSNADNCTGQNSLIPNVPICGYIYVDVNSTQLPNTLGQDIFYFLITNSNGYFLYPQEGLSTP